jgi:hypothetical protein
MLSLLSHIFVDVVHLIRLHARGGAARAKVPAFFGNNKLGGFCHAN